MNQQKTESTTARDTAMLAALIDPETCRTGNSRDALLRAMALFEESAALCAELANKSHPELLDMLMREWREGSKGARRLLDVILRLTTPTVPVLTLAASDGDADTLRPYLKKHCNLEGKSGEKAGRKSWDNVRTVLKNLRCWLVFAVNKDNSDDAAKIQAREASVEAAVQARGGSVEELRAGAGGGYYQHDQWQDAGRVCDQFFRRHGVGPYGEKGEPAGYSFPQEVVDRFIVWKKWIRTQKGGMSAVRPLTREDVFPRAIKKKNPKRRA